MGNVSQSNKLEMIQITNFRCSIVSFNRLLPPNIAISFLFLIHSQKKKTFNPTLYKRDDEGIESNFDPWEMISFFAASNFPLLPQKGGYKNVEWSLIKTFWKISFNENPSDIVDESFKTWRNGRKMDQNTIRSTMVVLESIELFFWTEIPHFSYWRIFFLFSVSWWNSAFGNENSDLHPLAVFRSKNEFPVIELWGWRILRKARAVYDEFVYQFAYELTLWLNDLMISSWN